MGTSGAYSGSGGAWNGARRELNDLLTGGGASPDDVLAPAAGAIDWDAEPVDRAAGDAAGGDDRPGSGEIPLIGTSVAPIRIRTRGGRGGGGVGVGAGGGRRQGTGGGSRRSRTSRSRQGAARIGASVAAAGYALRAGDATGLRRLGLDLSELVTLSPSQQAQRILDVLAGAAATIADVEVTKATSTMIIRLLEADTLPTAAETVAVFAAEYVYEIVLTELGSEMRDGSRDGGGTVVAEDDLHDVISARVAGLQIEGDSVEADALEAAIVEVLEFTRRVMLERPGE
ncbi:MAG: hypothetical protein H0W16_12580 [Actinobacteria bacterium]|nr:hypothetical protein [Actinomycetota bacterium]